MIHPAKKLLLAATVLAIGVGLAWPFRKTAESPTLADTRPSSATHVASGLAFQPQRAFQPQSAVDRSLRENLFVRKTRVGRGDSLVEANLASLPTPQLQLPPVRQVAKPVLPAAPPPSLPSQYEPDLLLQEDDTPRPVYATASGIGTTGGQTPPKWPAECVHEIQNGDTLAKLAKRYLGDPSRGLEIFDLNRDKLTNPHLLPIGADLRIPAKGRRTTD